MHNCKLSLNHPANVDSSTEICLEQSINRSLFLWIEINYVQSCVLKAGHNENGREIIGPRTAHMTTAIALHLY